MVMNLLNRQRIELVGLDIGNAAVKLVRLNKNEDGYTLVSAASEPIIQAPDNDEQQQKNCVNAITGCLKKADVKSRNVVCGISGPDVVVRGFSFPALPDSAVEQAVQMEAQQVCPLDMNHSVLDFQLIEAASTDTGKAAARQGVMTIGTEGAIRKQTELLSAAGVKPIMMDVNALAILNCLNELNLTKADETVAVIDIGNELTNVVIYGVDGLPFVRNINISGSAIIKEISRQSNLPEAKIRTLLTQQTTTDPLDGSLLLALNNAIRPLVNAINETVRFYSFQEKKSGVNRILLCGGFALNGAFIEFLTDAISIPLEVLNPFSAIRYDASTQTNQTLEKDGPAYVVATGLAMRTL